MAQPTRYIILKPSLLELILIILKLILTTTIDFDWELYTF